VDGYSIDDSRPLRFEVGVFDFDSRPTGQSEADLEMLDVHAATALLSDTQSHHATVLGTAVFEDAAKAVATKGHCFLSQPLQNGGGEVCLYVERSWTTAGYLLMQLKGHHLMSYSSLLSSSSSSALGGRCSNSPISPYFEVYRKVKRSTGDLWWSVYRSNVISHSMDPLWTAVSLNVATLCPGGGDSYRHHDDINNNNNNNNNHHPNAPQQQAFKIIVYDHRAKYGSPHKILGELETTLQGLLDAKQHGERFQLLKLDQVVGHIQVIQAQWLRDESASSSSLNTSSAPLSAPLYPPHASGPDASHPKKALVRSRYPRPEFVDYLSQGTHVSLAVAIDFTARNGDPRQPGTPHYFHSPESPQWNDYEKALFAVGSLLAKYDSDQRFPVWGFGAKYQNIVRHCFQCGIEDEVEGVQGMMDAYRGVFRTPLTMSYPTNLVEIIQTAASYARHKEEIADEEGGLSYTILLVLTSGCVENINETKRTLLEASEDPLSIVVVGIGDADFTEMQFLEEPQDYDELGGRHITKFIQFRDYKSFNALTEAVMDEFPNQLVTYFYDRGIMPGQIEENDHKMTEAEPAEDEDRTFTFLE
jgi:hypothetical protein